jgi:two-component system, NarL family, response regulator NreC
MTGKAKIRIALAEDHKLVREGLKALLVREAGFQIVGEAGDGVEAIKLVEREKPDVLLLDLRLPRLHGLEVLRQLRSHKGTHVVVVSMHADEPYVVEALRNGVKGYVLKDSPPSEMIQAIRAAADGGQFISPPLTQIALNTMLRRKSQGTQKDILTKRERLVLELAAEGKSNQEIADKLFISRRTAEAHRAHLMKKLGLKSQTDLVMYGIRKGITAP